MSAIDLKEVGPVPAATRGAVMQIQISKKVLGTALKALTRIIPSKTSNPALASVYVEAGIRGLAISGTNLELDLQLQVPAEFGLDSKMTPFVVNAHLLSGIVDKLPGELVELTIEGSLLHIVAGSAKFKLTLGQLNEYPPLSFTLTGEGLVADAEALRKSLASVLYASSSKAFQAVFNGVLLELHPERTRTVASDGFRLALRDTEAIAGINEASSLIIPGRSIPELIRLLAGSDTCKLFIGDRLLTVVTNQGTVVLKLMDGDFPDYERVIPKNIVLTANLTAALLHESIDRISLLSDKNANNRVELILASDTLTVSSHGDFGDCQDTMQIEQSGTEPALTAGFNSEYLLEGLKGMVGEVALCLSGVTSPALLTCSADPGLKAVIVPLRPE